MNEKITIITYNEFNERTKKKELFVSHGINSKGKTVILPNDTIEQAIKDRWARKNLKTGEYEVVESPIL